MEIYRRGQIRIVNFVKIAGSSINGIRPAVIISNDIGNDRAPICIVAPITSTGKFPFPFQIGLDKEKYDMTSDCVVLCEQIRTVDKMYVGRVISELDEADTEKLNRALKVSVGLF